MSAENPRVLVAEDNAAMAGVIRFAHWDANYKKRLAPDALLAKAREVIGSSGSGAELPRQ